MRQPSGHQVAKSLLSPGLEDFKTFPHDDTLPTRWTPFLSFDKIG
jgi:hypothetical protein